MSQERKILAWLKLGKPINPLQALSRFKCFRLAARIAELRNRGHNIKTTMIEAGGKRFARYDYVEINSRSNGIS